MTPTIILVRPQLGENIGAAARVMKNFSLEKLTIIAPRDGWPNPKAIEMASGAEDILENAQVVETLEEGIAGLQHCYAITARLRDINKPTSECHDIPKHLREERIAFLFGPERTGLTNQEISLCDTIVTIATNPKFSSLNLAQAVSVVCYECFGKGKKPVLVPKKNAGRNKIRENTLANKADILGLFEHLEGELDKKNFFKVQEKRQTMVENIRAMLTRAKLSNQEVQTLRGIIRSLAGK